MSEAKRLNYLDIAKGIGIILVIIAHISYLGTASRIFIVSFHMPLFFVISGILLFLKKDAETDFKDILIRLSRRLMLPYFGYSVLGILVYIAYYLLTGRDGGIPTVISDIIETLTFYGFSVMWFLPALFGAEILFLFIRKKSAGLSKRHPNSPVTAVLLHILITCAAIILNGFLEDANAVYGLDTFFSVFHLFAVAILRVPVCASFIAAGYYISFFWSRVKTLGPDSFSPLTIPADLFIGADLIIAAAVFSRINGVTDMHFLIFNNIPCYYAAALSGSFGLILICKACEGISAAPPFRLLAYFGKNSLLIMATHLNLYVLLLAEIGGFHFTKTLPEGTVKHMVFMILVTIFTLCGEIIIIESVRRISGIKKRRPDKL